MTAMILVIFVSLTGVRVPNDGDNGEGVALPALLPEFLPARPQLVHLGLHPLYLLAEQASIDLDLLLAHPLEVAPAAPAPALGVHPRALRHERVQAREHVPQLRRLDLQLGLP